MTKTLLRSLLPLCAAALSYLPASAQWQHVGAPNFAAGAVQYTSLVMSRDTPVVAFRDNSVTGGGKVTVMRYDGNGWGSIGNTGFSTNRVDGVSLAADSATGQLYVAYIDSVDGIHVDKFDGTNWVNIGGTGFVANVQSDEISMLVDGNGTPYVGYRDNNQSYKANMMRYDGSSWQQVGGADFSAQPSAEVAFAIDHHGTPYAVSEFSGFPENAQVQKYDGSAWVNVGVTDFDTADYASPVALTFGPNNQPYVALSYHDDHYPIKVWTYTTGWNLIGGQPATGTYSYDMKLAINSANVPLLSYADYNGTKQQSVKYYNGSAWIQLGPVNFTTGQADYGSLAINSKNDVFLAYEDYSQGQGVTVDEYLHNVGVHEVPGLEAFRMYPNPTTGRVQISFHQEQADEVTLTVSDLMGRTIQQNTVTSSTGTEVINLTGMARGIYNLQVKTATGMENRLIEMQ